MKINKVFLDLDGVLADFNKGIQNLLGITISPFNDPKNWGEWILSKVYNIPDEEIWHKCNYEFWANLPIYDYAPALYTTCKDIAPVTIVSSPRYDKLNCCEGKLDWIARYFPQVKDEVIFTRNKQQLASPDILLVDDYEVNTKAFEEKGGQTLLVPRPWNRHHELSNYNAMQITIDTLRKIKCLQ